MNGVVLESENPLYQNEVTAALLLEFADERLRYPHKSPLSILTEWAGAAGIAELRFAVLMPLAAALDADPLVIAIKQLALAELGPAFFLPNEAQIIRELHTRAVTERDSRLALQVYKEISRRTLQLSKRRATGANA